MTDPINPWLDADELKQLAESLMQGGPKPKAALPQDAGFSENFVGFAGGEPAAASLPPAPSPAPSPAPTPSKPASSSTSPPPPAPAAIPTPSSPPVATPVSVPNSTLEGQRPTPAVPAKPPEPITIPPVIENHPTPPARSAPLPPVEAPAPTSPAAPTEPIIVPTRTEAAVGSPEQQCEEFQHEMHQRFGSGPLFILNRNGHTVFGKDNHPQFQFIAQSLTKHAKRRGLPKGHIHIKVGPAQTLEIIPLDLPNGGWVIGTVVPKPLQTEQIQQWMRELSKLSSTLNQL